MSYELLNTLLESKKMSPIKSKKETPKKKAPVAPQRIKESSILEKELSTLVESAMKESLKNHINESTSINPDLKNRQVNVIEQAEFSDEQTYSFMKDTIDPLIESFGSSKSGKIVKSGKAKTISLPIYEIALTLEAARLGALNEQSKLDVAIKEDVDPNAQELEDVVNQQVNGGIESDTHDMGENATDESEFNEPQPMNRVTPMQVNSMMESEDLFNVQQQLDNTLATEKGAAQPSQTPPDQFQPVSDDSQLEDNVYEGDTAGDPDSEESSIYRGMQEHGSQIDRLIRSLTEELEATDDMDPNTLSTSAENIKTYEGEVVEGRSDDNNSGEFATDGLADEAIVENNQIKIAKVLLSRIFNEYGIKDQRIQKGMVREAVHYIFKYGVNNLYPSLSDLSEMVVEQNTQSYLNESVYNASSVVAGTEPKMSKAQRSLIEQKALAMASVLRNIANLKENFETAEKEESPASATFEQGPSNAQVRYEEALVEATQVLKAIKHITHASGIERTRQALRHRVHHFSEAAKKKVTSKWMFQERNLSEAANVVRDHITVRRYVTEAPELKAYFAQLGADSPVAKANFGKPKAYRTNDRLITASVVTEAACIWNSIRKMYYTKNTPLSVKKVALETMLTGLEGYKKLLNECKNPTSGLTVLENFSYRLHSLRDRIDAVMLAKKSAKKK